MRYVYHEFIYLLHLFYVDLGLLLLVQAMRFK